MYFQKVSLFRHNTPPDADKVQQKVMIDVDQKNTGKVQSLKVK